MIEDCICRRTKDNVFVQFMFMFMFLYRNPLTNAKVKL
jgi:hypothetical protein